MNPTFICSGMYAFNAQLKEAWESIFKEMSNYLPAPYRHNYSVIFEDNAELFSSIQMLIGQTCGYPYISSIHKTHNLVCVPDFNVEGCNEAKYSSWIVTQLSDDRTTLAEFEGATATINNWDSNSGMNVFRQAISKQVFSQSEKQTSFFSDVIENGSHLTSIELISCGKADIAAIDAVTWHFALVEGRVDPDKIQIIGQSVQTAGLPFVMNKLIPLDPEYVRLALNKALDNQPESIRDFIQINRFTKVTDSDYDLTRAIEQDAIDSGYPLLV